ncbi:MAG TPA: helix-turn-helix transcriptional regulator [Polyangiaceae bacterium]|nr:helix-turn-helix transcriptional regulator [Polyangiaceae bacterium]
MDFERLAAELLRALRGKRSQQALCRRLGSKSNVVHQWERGHSFPTASRTLQVAERVGVKVPEAFREFYRTAPRWLDEHEPTTPAGVAAFLDDLRGSTSVVELSRYSGKSRFAVARFLSGDAEPRLPDFLRLIEASSLRLLDFIEQLVDPRLLPSVKERWERLSAARRLAYDEPWSQAVLRALELSSYSALAAHEAGWIASRIGISLEEEQQCLERLKDSGQIVWRAPRWQIENVMALDTRRDPDAARRLRAWWLRRGAARIEAGERGLMYNLLGVSSADLQRLRELQKAYLTEVRAIVARSEPVEHVVLAADLLLDLRGESSA